MKQTESVSLMDTIVNIFPSNFIAPMAEANMLQVIVMSVFLDLELFFWEGEKYKTDSACNDLNDIFMKCMEMILSYLRSGCSVCCARLLQ